MPKKRAGTFFLLRQLFCGIKCLKNFFQTIFTGLPRKNLLSNFGKYIAAIRLHLLGKSFRSTEMRPANGDGGIIMRLWIVVTAAIFLMLLFASPNFAEENQSVPVIRVGIIGLDTSHVLHFTTALNAQEPPPELAGCHVVAAYPKGSPDIQTSVSRVPEYTKQLREMGVEIVDSIDALVERVDAVLLETNDGRPHLEQAMPAIKAGKRMFIDKPMAASLTDVILMFDAAKHYKVPIFSSSALRFAKDTQAVQKGSVGDVLACDVYSPCALEPTHPDLSWYGIHGVEALISVMGSNCRTVSLTHELYQDVAVGVWDDGRIGTYRGMRLDIPSVGGEKGRIVVNRGKSVLAPTFGGMAFGSKGNQTMGSFDGYEPLLMSIVKFFRTGDPPCSPDQTIAIMAFIEAAERSKTLGGIPVNVNDIMAAARADAKLRRSW